MAEVDRIRPAALLCAAMPLLARLPQVVRGYRLINTSALDRCYSIGQVLEDNARRHPDFPALRFEGRDISHAELNARSNRIARVLGERGIGPGDRVGVLMENRPELIVCVAGVVKLGAIAVVHNHRLPAAALAHCVDLAPGKAMIVGAERVEYWQQMAGQVRTGPPTALFWVADPDADPLPAGWLDLAEQARGRAKDNLAETAAVRLGDPCFYVFTSGTTGLPKAAVIKHIRWIKAMGAFGLMALGFKPGQVLYNVLPFYHNTALAVAWSACAASGACLAIGRHFSASKFWDEIRANRADGFVYIGELCRFLLNRPRSPDDRHHSARAMVGNGLRPDIWDEFKRRFAVQRVYELYGASEANIAFFNILNQDRTVGLCPADYALVACDLETGRPERDAGGRLIRVGPGQTGLLLGKVTAAYPYDGYTDLEASREKLIRDAFVKGDCWFNTGDLLADLGCRHARFIDRLGDTYRWRGENVATTEVEAVAMALDSIAEAVAFGVEIPGAEGRAGMLVFHLAEAADEAQVVAELAAWMDARLPDYAVPVVLRRVARLDATGTFKFVKKELQRQALSSDCADPLWLRLPGQRDYRPLTPELTRRLAAGELGF